MFTLSAFADEIDPDPRKQIEVLSACGIRHIEFRSIHKVNVLSLADAPLAEFKALLNQHRFQLSAIGSPIGKIRIDEPFGPHLEKFRRAIELAKLFGTRNIRIFSYYPPIGDDWDDCEDAERKEVFDRMRQKVELAEKEDVVLLHENEHRIFGDSPARIRELFQTIRSPHFRAAYDPANFVHSGYDPFEGWQASKPYLAHIHIKDWILGQEHASLPGQGQGRIPEVIAEAVQLGYQGFATMEPHLQAAGPTGGFTGPELFPKAVAAFRDILRQAGATEAA